MFAEIVVNRPTHRRPQPGDDPGYRDAWYLVTYTYRLPSHLQDKVRPGHLVLVPLGASNALGIVVALTDALPEHLTETAIRDVAEVLDPLPVVTPVQIELAYWIANQYLAPLSETFRLMLPPGIEERTFVVITQRTEGMPGGLAPEEQEVWRLLQSRGGRARLSTLLAQVHVDQLEATIDRLAERGLVMVHHALVPPRPLPPRVQYVRLVADEATIQATLPRLGRSSSRADLLMLVARQRGAPLTVGELCQRVGCREEPVRALVERGWLKITEPRTLIVALPEARTADLARAPRQAAVLSLLLSRGGPVEKKELLARTGASPTVITALEEKGLVQRIREEPMVLLALPPDQVMNRIIELRGIEKELAVLAALRGTVGRVWVGGIYAQTGADLGTLRHLADHGLISLHAEQFDRPPLPDRRPLPSLTSDQEAVWREIERGLHQAGAGKEPYVALIHGVTGSGKTEIYLRALAATLTKGQRAIVLVPEISLTAQTVQRFEARFPGRVAVFHSRLTPGQRYAVWDRIRRGEADIVIGPRSALFTPVSRLGLIVLDEVHDHSYKQMEPIPLPAYHARDVAVALGRIAGAAVVLGSATPDLVSYYRATHGIYHLLELPQRIMTQPPAAAPQRARRQEVLPSPRPVSAPLPPVQVVDLRQELQAGNRSILSRVLQKALQQTLEAGEQAILFLNRRGTATFVLCRDCGYVARCPRCEVPLTFHRSAGSESSRLICHRCNHREPAPVLCPQCKSRRIRYFGLGTERVEAAVRELCPEARLLRWDRDTATSAEPEQFLQAFIERRADVLIGTQMIAKGLDFPMVTLVGVISADTALYLPDYRTAETTFQLLTQVAGRAGRSSRGGQVIIQTYNPDHYAIQAAAKHDFHRFYRQELTHRRQLGYPPFARLVALRFSDPDPERCRAAAERLGRWLAAEIQRLGRPIDLIGPAPCFFSRVRGRTRWQIVLRGPDPLSWLQGVVLPWGWQVDVDPISLL